MAALLVSQDKHPATPIVVEQAALKDIPSKQYVESVSCKQFGFQDSDRVVN